MMAIVSATGPAWSRGHCLAATSIHLDLEALQLGQEDDDGETVDEAKHDRMRDHADEFAQSEQAHQDLDQAHQYDGGKQVFSAMLCSKCHHDYRESTGGTRNHPRATTYDCGNEANHEGGIETNQRFYSCLAALTLILGGTEKSS